MPGFAFTPLQVVTALAIGRITPVAGSPLGMLPEYPRASAPGEADFDQLVELGFVRAEGSRWALNRALAAVLIAAADPEELIDLAFSELSIPGVTIVRHGDLIFECTIGVGGTTKIYFPLTRDAVFARVMEAFSGDRPLAPRVGFRFVGSAAEAFVLSATLRRLRTDLRPCHLGDLPAIVMTAAADRFYAGPFEAMVGPGTIADLVRRPDQLRGALDRLVDQRHLVVTDGMVDAAPAARAVLEAGLGPSIALSRTELTGGSVRRAGMQVMRCGGYLLVFRRRSPAGSEPSFEWAEVDRVQLRWLVSSYLLTPEDLAVLVEEMDRTGTTPAAGSTLDEPAAPVRASAPSPAPTAPPWLPTHLVPAQGSPAWDQPVGGHAPVASLDPFLPVRVDAWHGVYARVTCANGWACWVDGRVLTPR